MRNDLPVTSFAPIWTKFLNKYFQTCVEETVFYKFKSGFCFVLTEAG